MTITLTREEAQQVLDALRAVEDLTTHDDEVYAAIDIIEPLLAQPEQKPVAWSVTLEGDHIGNFYVKQQDAEKAMHDLNKDWPQWARKVIPLYTAPPQPEPKDDGYCQACEGNHCTAKTGCVALSNPPQNKWEPQIERKYSPDGVLLSEKIKYTPDGEWKDLKQYPVAWWYDMGDVIDLNVSGRVIPLYFAPPQREWQGLTDEEYEATAEKYVTNCYFDTLKYARAIEAKLKEKNT